MVKIIFDCPDLHKNGSIKKKTIGSFDTPYGKIKITTCYRNGKVSWDVTDFNLEFAKKYENGDEESSFCKFIIGEIDNSGDKLFRISYPYLLDFFHKLEETNET